MTLETKTYHSFIGEVVVEIDWGHPSLEGLDAESVNELVTGQEPPLAMSAHGNLMVDQTRYHPAIRISLCNITSWEGGDPPFIEDPREEDGSE